MDKIAFHDMMKCSGCTATTSRLSEFYCKICGAMLCGDCGDTCIDHRNFVAVTEIMTTSTAGQIMV